MDPLAVVRPDRRLGLPFAVAFAPMAWFVARDVSAATPRPAVGPLLRFIALISASAVASYVLAVLIVGVVSFGECSLPEPDDATLRIFSAVVAAGLGYLALATFRSNPGWLDLLVAPVGLVLGLPLVVLYGGFVAVANIVPALQYGIAPFVVVGVGVACSVLWTYLLTSILARKFGP